MKATAVIALAALLTPSVALAQVAQRSNNNGTTVVIPEREETYTTTSLNTPVIMGGAILFLGAYGASVAVAANSENPAADRLYVPVLGPWLALNEWGDCDNIRNEACDKTTTAKVLLIGDGVAQALGVLTFTGGLLSPRRHTVIDAEVAKGVHVRPTHNGAVVYGRF